MIGRAELGADLGAGVAARSPAEEYLAGLSLTSQGIERAILSLASPRPRAVRLGPHKPGELSETSSKEALAA